MDQYEHSDECSRLEQAIAALEAQRVTLGDGVVDAALEPLRRQLDSLQQTGPVLAGERKLVTVMFADISGFTALAEKLDPEVVRDLINACFEQLVPIVEKYGGTVDKFIGDEIMALFGAPLAHENDPERALRAALDMVSQLSFFNQRHSTDLGLHFGINTGLVIAGGIGTHGRQEYSVMGDAVNLAARLEEVSERGEILVGPDTYRLTAPLFDFCPLKPVQVKGKEEPVPTWRLVGPSATPGRVRGLEARGIRSPLVGRGAELATLNGCLERLLDGHGGLVSVTGEAGVGKSRLMAEVRGQERPVQWLEGHVLSFGQTISYWPFQQILWQLCGINDRDSEATAWQKLSDRVHALFGRETGEVLPYLATLLAIEVRKEYADRVRYLDGEAMKRQVFAASRRLFLRLAKTQPLVLVLEDLHWVDESSALLLEHLMPLVVQVPLLIFEVGRPYPQTASARLRETAVREYREYHTRVSLAPLSRADSVQLVRNLLEIEHLSPRVRETIVGKAEGNPFYLEEIIRALIDAGAVVHDPASGSWRATAQAETFDVPDTVQGVIMTRVDRLDRDVKQALRTAAVIGRSFLYRVLRAVEDVGLQLDAHLRELQAIELIWEKRRLPELEYMFRHVLAQEATYESILLQERRALHARVGQAIEALFAERLDEFYGLLAYHYARAEDWTKAQEYLLKAGDQAVLVAADAEALAHYRRAMEAYARAFGDEWDPLQRAALERKIGEALFRRGDHQEAFEHLERALTCLGKPLPTSRWGVRLAILAGVVQQISHWVLPGLTPGPAERSVALAVEEAFRVYEIVAWMEAMTDPERSLLVALLGLNASERDGFSYGVAVGAGLLGTLADALSLFGLAQIYHHRAIGVVEQIRHLGATGLAHLGLTVHYASLGDWDAAVEHGREASWAFKETGDLHSWGNAHHVLGFALNYQGHFAQALEQCDDMVRLGQDGGDRQVVCWGLSGQGCALRRLGRFDEAVTRLRKAVATAKAIPDYVTQVEVSGKLGQSYLRQGELDQALSVLHTGQQVYAEHRVGWGLGLPLFHGLAEAYLLSAEQADPSERSRWLKRARQSCQAALRMSRSFRHGLPETMMLRGRCEWLAGRRIVAQRWWRRSLAWAAKMGQRYDLGMTHLEVGRRLGEKRHLERAKDILTEVGAEWAVAQT
jgi:class 3 adenylate cyclase